MAERLTRQGVRDLNPPRNVRQKPQMSECLHEWEHARDCVGCWAENYGGYERGAHKHDHRCRKCPEIRSF